MKINIENPTIDNKHRVNAKIQCPGLNASGEVDMQFSDLLPFAANKRTVDLFFLASFVYGIDRFIERHKYSEDGWSRTLEVKIPVYDVQAWNNATTVLEELLSFLTGDYWNVSFYKNNLKLPSEEISDELKLKFSQVNLFSGGLDSLIGAIDFLTESKTKNLLVVSHFDPHISARKEQNVLRGKLKEKYPDNFHFIPSVSVSLGGSNIEKEKTFRSRSLLFISIATLVADHQNLPILVPENGTVSLNFPLSSSRRSACSTRTTHPTFLKKVKELLLCLGLNSKVENIYDLKTKGEMVDECKDLPYLKEIVEISNSCGKRGHRANWTYGERGHCGVCMPCIYRQASLQNIPDNSGYGNSINKKYTGRNSQTPFLFSKQGQDFAACLLYLKKKLSDEDIRTELLINGVTDFTKIDDYVELVKRTRLELKKWIKKVGEQPVKTRAGIK
jgi:7-cyano-7-deazaguanine synthase in queuosine biosynthesis